MRRLFLEDLFENLNMRKPLFLAEKIRLSGSNFRVQGLMLSDMCQMPVLCVFCVLKLS